MFCVCECDYFCLYILRRQFSSSLLDVVGHSAVCNEREKKTKRKEWIKFASKLSQKFPFNFLCRHSSRIQSHSIFIFPQYIQRRRCHRWLVRTSFAPIRFLFHYYYHEPRTSFFLLIQRQQQHPYFILLCTTHTHTHIDDVFICAASNCCCCCCCYTTG